MIKKKKLYELYVSKKMSVREIAEVVGLSQGAVNYWIKKFCIPKRSISEAIYVRSNPNGDPFIFHSPQTKKEAFLYGLGVGLYWGEGTKADISSVRLGNTDAGLILKFIEFLETIWGISRSRMRFGVQIFDDGDSKKILNYWVKTLRVSKGQFQKVVVTKPRGAGTYRKKVKNGVLTLYFHNKKLNKIFAEELKKIGSSI